MARQSNQRRGGDRGGMTGPLPSPYNFVRLSPLVIDDWLDDRPSQDRPYAEGMSGRLDLELRCDTPILVSGPGGGAKRFHEVNGRYTIPGSSVRGMIRNVVEIMSFSRFSRVANRRFGLRDLSGAAPEYTSKMTKASPGRGFASRVEAAWLSRDADGWRLRRCDFARIQHEDLERLADAAGVRTWRRDVRALQGAPGQRPAIPASLRSSAVKDPASLAAMHLIWRGAPRRMTLDVEPDPTDHPDSRGNTLIYAQAFAPGGGTPLRTMHADGELVFTGQPSSKKHMEFFFHAESAEDEAAPEVATRDFLDVNQDGPGWTFWSGELDRGAVNRIPVFISLGADDECEAIGLSMMFRYPQTYSTHQLRNHTSPRHASCEGRDLADRLFGRTDERDEADGIEGGSFQGRVAFGDAPVIDAAAAVEEAPHRTVLGAPKPQYFPGYVRQTDTDGDRIKPNDRGRFVYRKYMEDGRSPKPELRGWKRYPARSGAVSATPPPPPNGASDDATVELAPLRQRGDEALRFRARVRFHNLLPFELGALAWALDFGGAEGARHALGMGKPFGWGRVALSLERVEIESNRIEPGATARPVSEGDAARDRLTDCVRAYGEKADEYFAGAWAESDQVRQLVAMATPTPNPPHPLHYPLLEVPGRNEFQDAKRAGLYLVDWCASGVGPAAALRSGATNGQNLGAAGPTFVKGDKVNMKNKNTGKTGKSVATVTRNQSNSLQKVHIVWPDGRAMLVEPGKLLKA